MPQGQLSIECACEHAGRNPQVEPAPARRPPCTWPTPRPVAPALCKGQSLWLDVAPPRLRPGAREAARGGLTGVLVGQGDEAAGDVSAPVEAHHLGLHVPAGRLCNSKVGPERLAGGTCRGLSPGRGGRPAQGAKGRGRRPGPGRLSGPRPPAPPASRRHQTGTTKDGRGPSHLVRRARASGAGAPGRGRSPRPGIRLPRPTRGPAEVAARTPLRPGARLGEDCLN